MKNNLSTPEALCIGFFCHDAHQEEFILGGTASYSSMMLQKLGQQTAVLTSVGDDFLFWHQFNQLKMEVHNKKAAHTTIFHNLYEKEKRTQYMDVRANTLYAADVPLHWRNVPLVKFCLIADEADASLLDLFPNALIGATIQGWLRKWDEQGKISPKAMNWEMLRKIEVVIFSEDDLNGLKNPLPSIIQMVNIAVMTRGKKGAIVYKDGQSYNFPAFPTTEVDPTGAGDVFAATFLHYFHRTKEIALACGYAHAAASYVVEKVGVQLPNKEIVEKRFAAYQQLFLAGLKTKDK